MRLLLLSTFFLLLLPTVGTAQGTPTWQQRVAYDMNIVMDAPANQFTGTQRLTLINESPDTLFHVYYHLYFNAFQPTSLMAERNRQLPDPDGRVVPRIFELGPDEVGYHVVEALSQEGTPIPFKVDDTLLRAELARPVPPGGTTTFEMAFHSQVPLQTRRSGRDSREGIDFSMSQWYPKLAYYDSRGWHADPYIGREFYAPFGTFDVRITLPTEYTIGATGVLQNAEEVGHGYGTREVERAPGTPVTWHFNAEDVHDFAWAADRDYIHDKIEGADGVTYHLLYQPNVAEGWQFLRRFVPAVIQYFSQHIGPYVYPQFTVAQAGDGGMEYPMINFITGGRTPGSLVGVTAHEAAHEWFYSMLGSNESDYPWMDEGFTSYWTDEAIAALLTNRPASHRGATLGVMTLQENGLFEPFNTSSDWFETNRAYSVASYSGGQMIADQLGYVISDSLRDRFFKAYYQQFLLRHPQPADVERVAENVSGIELDWFFRQIAEQNVRMDYALDRLESEDVARSGSSFATDVKLSRRDKMVYPIDLRLTYSDGSEQWVTIPTVEMGTAKPVPADWLTAPAWGWTFPTYTLRLTTPKRVVRAEIDPLGRTPDHNRLNNGTRTPREVAFLEAPVPTLDHYSVGWRPLATYADRFGVGVGVQLRGTYWMGRHQKKAMLTVYPQAFDPDALLPDGAAGSELALSRVDNRSWFDAIDYALGYSTPLRGLSPHTRLSLSAEKHVGVMENRVELAHTFGRFAALGHTKGTLRLYGVQQLQPTRRGFAYDGFSAFLGDHLAYLGARYEVGRGTDRIAATVDVGGSFRRISFNFINDFGIHLLSIPLERTSATRFVVEAQKALPLGRAAVRARTLLGFGSDALANHRRFRLGAASLEDAWRTAATRQILALDDNLVDEVPFQALSGVGPVAYAIPQNAGCGALEPCADLAGNTLTGTQAWMGSVELALPRVQRPLLMPLEVTAFSGAGVVFGRPLYGDAQPFTLDDLVADAGIGLTYDVAQLRSLRRWTMQSDFLQTLKLAARFPFWASDPELIGPDEDAFAFRYLFGIEIGL